jgi:RNA polymerase sigma-32 factor
MTTKNLQLTDSSLPIGSLSAYITWANKMPMLKPEEEVALAKKFQQGNDLSAARQLVLSHLRLVIHIARGYQGFGLAYGDLIQEGTVGLMKAVKHFNPDLGVRLVSFAIHWIKAEIHEFILRNYRIVKIATTKAQRKLFFNLRKLTKNALTTQLETIKNVAKTLNVKIKDVELMQMRLNGTDMSMESFANDDQNEDVLAPIDYLEMPNANPAQILEEENWDQTNTLRVRNALANLDKRSKEIITERWLKGKKITLKELAKKHGISIERIRQLEEAALIQLKTALGTECA